MDKPIIPRRSLLPPYMSHQAWQDLADTVDTVFGDKVDTFIEPLKWLRETYVFDDRKSPMTGAPVHPVQVKIDNREMISETEYDVYDSVTQRLRLNQLGLRLMDPTLVDDASINRLIQNIGLFWYSKGLASFLDFISFCLNTAAEYVNLWTQDYISFVPEGDPGIGTPVWNGGTWYPTTHIRVLIIDPGLVNGTTLRNFVRLFYDIANYNLVLEGISYAEYHYVLPASDADDLDKQPGTPPYVCPPAHITAAAYMCGRVETIIGEP